MSKFNQQKYFEDIIRWQHSGLSQKVWCEENGVNYSTFHYWYRRFRNQNTDDSQTANDSFVQLKVQDRPPGLPWCELVLINGHKLSFYQMVPSEFIRSLLD